MNVLVQLFRRFAYRVRRQEPFGEVLARVVATLRESGAGDAPLRFHLEEASEARRSVVDRLVARFPVLAAFRHQDVLSNFDARWEQPPPAPNPGAVPTDLLLELAHGIPRSFPIGDACFFVEGVPWLTLDAAPSPPRGPWARTSFEYYGPGYTDPAPSVSLRRSSITGVHMVAVAAQAPPATGDRRLPPLPVETMRRLAQLGKAAKGELLVAADPDAAARMLDARTRGKEVVARWDRGCASLVPGLPHALPPDPGPAVYGAFMPDVAPVVRLLALRGYQRATKLGQHDFTHAGRTFSYAVAKRTPRGNQLVVRFVVRAVARLEDWSHRVSCSLHARGALWRHDLATPVAPSGSVEHGDEYPVAHQDVWNALVENAAAMIDHAEASVVRELEDVYPETPAWFELPSRLVV